MEARKIYNAIKDYLVIFLGLIIYGFAWQGFIYSHDVTTGGLAGIASLISWTTHMNVSIPYNVINFFLLMAALKILGWRFSLKTVFSVVCLAFVIPFFSLIFQPKPTGMSGIQETIYNFFEPIVVGQPMLMNDPFLAVLLGGMLAGLSLGMVFSVNGSTGGTDIVAAIINKYKSITIGRAMIVMDTLIIGSSYFIFRSPDKLVYSFVEVMACNLTLDYFLNGYRQSVQFFIISRHHKEISNRILKDVNRGCTILNGEGAYSAAEVKVMMVIAKKTESTMIFRAVQEIDPQAFITQSLVRGVYGQGFDVLKIKEDRRKKLALKKLSLKKKSQESNHTGVES